MEFESKEDIEAPIADVFGVVSDFEGFERSAIRRGIDVSRQGDVQAPDKGLAWDVKFSFRGKARDLHLVLDGYDPVNGMTLASSGSGIEGRVTVDLVALSPRRTRLVVKTALEAKTLSARLLVQSLKLARGKLTKRYRLRVAEFAKHTEERLQQTA